MENQEKNNINSSEFFQNIKNLIHEFMQHPYIVENQWDIKKYYPGMNLDIKLQQRIQEILNEMSPETRENA